MCLRAVRELTELVECPERPDQRYTRLHFCAGTSSFRALSEVIANVANVANVACAGRQRLRRTPGAARREGTQGESRLSSSEMSENWFKRFTG